jgi:hypothetical protein
MKRSGPDTAEVPAQPSAPGVEDLVDENVDEIAETEDAEEEGAGGPALTAREVEILDFEQKWWRHPGAKEQAIRDTFAMSATRYYQLLSVLLDNPAAMAHDPVLVGRLRRLRTTRARGRRPT